MKNPSDMTAVEATKAIACGTLTAGALIDSCLDRIAACDPKLKAFVHVDGDGARQRALCVDKGLVTGPLAGVPLAVKDVLDTGDMPSEYGSPIWRGHRPVADAACVSLARNAGAIMLGKTATTEFATRFPSATVNPVDPAHTPGGSSSGSAAAVAAHFCPVAFATQTAGSIIRPAAFCGIVGFKPTFGTFHRAGMKVMSEELDTIGVVARTIADCAFFVASATGLDLGDPERPLARPPRLALMIEPPAGHAQDMIARMFETADLARRAGATVEHIAPSQSLLDAYNAHPLVMNMEIARALAWETVAHRDGFSHLLSETIDWSTQQPPGALPRARQILAVARGHFDSMMDRYDAILTPSAPGEAPAGLAYTGDPACNILWSALHAPAVTVPAGQGSSGLPLGIQIVARRGADALALSIARWLQAAMS